MKHKFLVIKPIFISLIIAVVSFFGLIVNAQDVQITKTEFEKFQDIIITADGSESFDTQHEAEETLIKKYSNVKIKGSDKTVNIDSWIIDKNSADYDVKKPGTYTFIAVLNFDDEMNLSGTQIIYPTINIVIKEAETPKIAIKKFSVFKNIQLNSINTDGFTTLSEAKNTLLKKYNSVKVNDSQDELQISSWEFDEKNVQYIPAKEGTYTFTAALTDSQKYNTSKLDIPLPSIKVIITAPKGTVRIIVKTDNDEKINNADITISNENKVYYGATDINGECILNNIKYGSYKVFICSKNDSFNQYITVNKEDIINIEWSIPVEKTTTAITEKETEKSTTTQKQAETTTVINYREELISNKNEPIEITSFESDSGLKVGVSIDKLSAKQLAELKNMSNSDVYSEIQKIITAVSTVNFNDTPYDAKHQLSIDTEGQCVRVIPINFKLHASFVFPVKISISVGKDIYPVRDDYSLYYYNSETKVLEESGNASVDGNGIITFVISHCSDYFVLDKEITAKDVVYNRKKSTITETSIISDEANADIAETTKLNKNDAVTAIALNNEITTSAAQKNETVTTTAKNETAATTKTAETKDTAKSEIGKKLIIFGFALSITCGWLLSRRNKVKRLKDMDDKDEE